MRFTIGSLVWHQVLSFLPVKCLLRFRCVCRSWLSLIDDPDFARSQLTRFSNNRDETHLLTVQSNMENGCAVMCSKNFLATSRLASLDTGDTHLTPLPAYGGVKKWEIASSVDGLVMLRSSASMICDQVLFMLWNPSIRKFRSVPTLPEFVISQSVKALEWHLGFDPVSKDYKYVRVVQTDRLKYIAVFSVGTYSWKKFEFQGEACSRLYRNFDFMWRVFV